MRRSSMFYRNDPPVFPTDIIFYDERTDVAQALVFADGEEPLMGPGDDLLIRARQLADRKGLQFLYNCPDRDRPANEPLHV